MPNNLTKDMIEGCRIAFKESSDLNIEAWIFEELLQSAEALDKMEAKHGPHDADEPTHYEACKCCQTFHRMEQEADKLKKELSFLNEWAEGSKKTGKRLFLELNNTKASLREIMKRNGEMVSVMERTVQVLMGGDDFDKLEDWAKVLVRAMNNCIAKATACEGGA